MHKIESKPTAGLYLAMVIMGVLSLVGWLPGSPVPLWASLIFLFLVVLLLLSLRSVTLDEEKIEARQLITGGRTIVLLKEVESIRVARMPPTLSSMIGLVKQGRLMSITDVHGRKLNISDKSTRRFDAMLAFLEEKLPGKVTDYSRR